MPDGDGDVEFGRISSTAEATPAEDRVDRAPPAFGLGLVPDRLELRHDHSNVFANHLRADVDAESLGFLLQATLELLEIGHVADLQARAIRHLG